MQICLTFDFCSKQRVMSDASKEKLKNKIAQAYKKDGTELENLTKDVIRACQEEDLVSDTFVTINAVITFTIVCVTL